MNFSNTIPLYAGYKALLRNYVGLNGASSAQDKLFQCPADTFYPNWLVTLGPPQNYFVQKSLARRALYSIFQAICLMAEITVPRKFGGLTPAYPGLGGVRLSAVRHPCQDCVGGRNLGVRSVFHGTTRHHTVRLMRAEREYNDSRNVVSFVDGHVNFIKIYWNPGHGEACWYNPPEGYDYQWSPD